MFHLSDRYMEFGNLATDNAGYPALIELIMMLNYF